MRINPISVPTPFYVGPVNVYLIKADPVTLIDVGPKTPEAVEALRSGLAKQGVRFGDVRRIVLTHAHEDHCGLAKKVRDEAKNAEILIHDWESGHLVERLGRDEHHSLMLRGGVPDDVFQKLQALYAEIGDLTDPIDEGEFSSLRDDAELEFENGTLRVLHTPGHTPGSCSFFREADRTLICGDCVLKRITPNPILAPDPNDPSKRFRSLAEYLVSLGRIRELKPTLLYGGHGEPIHDFEEIFHRYVRAIDERQRNVISMVPPAGTTAYEVARKLFPDSVDKDVHRFLAISEAIAHLDYAHGEGKLGVEIKDGVEYYTR